MHNYTNLPHYEGGVILSLFFTLMRFYRKHFGFFWRTQNVSYKIALERKTAAESRHCWCFYYAWPDSETRMAKMSPCRHKGSNIICRPHAVRSTATCLSQRLNVWNVLSPVTNSPGLTATDHNVSPRLRHQRSSLACVTMAACDGLVRLLTMELVQRHSL